MPNSPPSDLRERSEVASSELIRRADVAVSRLNLQSANALRQAVSACLLLSNRKDVPEQTLDLASIHWPLVITTNYDDLYAFSADPHFPRILGRSVNDCNEIVQSLTLSAQPILWAIQGFLPGQIDSQNQLQTKTSARLEDELVVGHAQYQRVINLQQHFRRAFADVFRRRVFLFLGSSIEEDYILNLFSEIALTYGRSYLPRFALFADCSKSKKEFLLRNYNIQVIDCSHDDLKVFLKELKIACDLKAINGMENMHRSVKRREYQLNHGKLILDLDSLPKVYPPACIAVSVGKHGEDEGYRPKEGEQARLVLNLYELERRAWNVRVPEGNKKDAIIFQHQNTRGKSVFAIAARDEVSRKRQLTVIPQAITQFLCLCDSEKFTTVHCGLLSAGKRNDIWLPIHSLMQMLRGIKNYFRLNPASSIEEVVLNIIDPSLRHAILAEQLRVEEFLMFDKFPVEVSVEIGDADSFSVVTFASDETTVSAIAAEVGIVQRIDEWMVETLPRSVRDSSASELAYVQDGTLANIGVVPQSKIIFRRKTSAASRS